MTDARNDSCRQGAPLTGRTVTWTRTSGDVCCHARHNERKNEETRHEI